MNLSEKTKINKILLGQNLSFGQLDLFLNFLLFEKFEIEEFLFGEEFVFVLVLLAYDLLLVFNRSQQTPGMTHVFPLIQLGDVSMKSIKFLVNFDNFFLGVILLYNIGLMNNIKNLVLSLFLGLFQHSQSLLLFLFKLSHLLVVTLNLTDVLSQLGETN